MSQAAVSTQTAAHHKRVSHVGSATVKQTASRCAPADQTGLSPGEKTQLFQQFDQWQGVRHDDGNTAAKALVASAGDPPGLPACPEPR
jgi:hypothetical protein